MSNQPKSNPGMAKISPDLLPVTLSGKTSGTLGYFNVWIGIGIIIATFAVGGEAAYYCNLKQIAFAPGPSPRSWPCWPPPRQYRCSCKNTSGGRSSNTSAVSLFTKVWETSFAAWMSPSPQEATRQRRGVHLPICQDRERPDHLPQHPGDLRPRGCDGLYRRCAISV